EPFAAGMKGSSAMPHKRNPKVAERVSGLARIVRAAALVGLENMPLWHERDISHSSAERVVIPDAFFAVDYMLDRFAWIVEGLVVYPERMERNLWASHGLFFSHRLLLALIESGLDRAQAYELVQRNAMQAWDKGRVLTGVSGFWFTKTRDLVPNHLLALRSDGRSSECRRLEMLPIECVVRGYLAGSGWKDYVASGEVCGHRLPPGLVESEQLPRPIFTPATKAETGHDENIDRAAAIELVGEERFDEVEAVALALYSFVSDYARDRGIILADTKLEFGVDERGELVLGDEAFTPDSSRFWPAE